MDTKSLLLFAIPYLLSVTLVLSLVFLPFYISALALLLKGATDFVVASPAILAFKRRRLIRFFPLFEAYYFLYVLLFPLIVLFASEVVWKERALSNESSKKRKAPRIAGSSF